MPISNACSIVICTYNRLPYLRECVAALRNLDLKGITAEIIIVNDGSTDGTDEFLALLPAPFRGINLSRNVGISSAKNIGIGEARYDILLFTDDDCAPKADWVKKLIIGFTDDKIGAVIGQTFYRSETYKGYFPERLVHNKDARWPMGGNIAYKKEVLKKIGGVSDRFFRYHNEDTELGLRAVRAGVLFARATNAIVYHQAAVWTKESLLFSAKNASVWPILKNLYPKEYLFFQPPIWKGIIVNPIDYLFIFLLPIAIPLLLIRYLLQGKRDLKIFFTKWPVHLLQRRYYVYREALKNRVFMI